jgi:hypothetical protein
LARRFDGELNEAVHFSPVFHRHGLCDIETLGIFTHVANDTSNLAVDIRNDGIVEPPDARLPSNETPPARVDTRSER